MRLPHLDGWSRCRELNFLFEKTLVSRAIEYPGSVQIDVMV